jgi:PLP dependent protein
MTTIASRLQAVNERIARAARDAGRLPQDVTLVAVSKAFPMTSISEAYAAGQRAFGENYVQEALDKISALSRLIVSGHVAPENGDNERPGGAVHPSAGVASPQAGPLLRPLEWHFIGPIQSNKTRPIAEHFSWVHGVEREKIAVRLSEARPVHLPPLQVCIQVNVSGEQSKSGVEPELAPDLAIAVSRLPRLRLRGLMAIPEPTANEALRHARFRALRALRDDIVRRGLDLDTLSMGMSDDLEPAIAEGATLVRIGTAVFGARPALRPG